MIFACVQLNLRYYKIYVRLINCMLKGVCGKYGWDGLGMGRGEGNNYIAEISRDSSQALYKNIVLELIQICLCLMLTNSFLFQNILFLCVYIYR